MVLTWPRPLHRICKAELTIKKLVMQAWMELYCRDFRKPESSLLSMEETASNHLQVLHSKLIDLIPLVIPPGVREINDAAHLDGCEYISLLLI